MLLSCTNILLTISDWIVKLVMHIQTWWFCIKWGLNGVLLIYFTDYYLGSKLCVRKMLSHQCWNSLGNWSWNCCAFPETPLWLLMSWFPMAPRHLLSHCCLICGIVAGSLVPPLVNPIWHIRQNDRLSADNIFIFFPENSYTCILIQISLEFFSNWSIWQKLNIGSGNCLAPIRCQWWLNQWWLCSLMHVDGLVQDCSISIANTQEILRSCTKPSIYIYMHHQASGGYFLKIGISDACHQSMCQEMVEEKIQI